MIRKGSKQSKGVKKALPAKKKSSGWWPANDRKDMWVDWRKREEGDEPTERQSKPAAPRVAARPILRVRATRPLRPRPRPRPVLAKPKAPLSEQSSDVIRKAKPSDVTKAPVSKTVVEDFPAVVKPIAVVDLAEDDGVVNLLGERKCQWILLLAISMSIVMLFLFGGTLVPDFGAPTGFTLGFCASMPMAFLVSMLFMSKKTKRAAATPESPRATAVSAH